MEQSKSLIASISVIFEPNIDTAKRNIRKSLKISGILRSIVRKKKNDKRRNEPLHYLHHQKNKISYCQMQCYEVENSLHAPEKHTGACQKSGLTKQNGP